MAQDILLIGSRLLVPWLEARQTMLTMVFKLCQGAEKRWRRLQGYKLLADVIRGVKFVDGIREDRIAA